MLILAAGGSSRMGSPKQLLPWFGKSLICHITERALSAQGFSETVVVLGANSEKLIEEIRHLEVEIVVNTNWEQGMSSSIRAGMKELLKIVPEMESVCILLADQPFLEATHLENLLHQHLQSETWITGTRYRESYGPPVIFNQALFDELCSLEGDSGAKKLIDQHRDKATFVESLTIEADLDTRADYKKLKDQYSKNKE